MTSRSGPNAVFLDEDVGTKLLSITSALNSSTVPLAAGAIFTGEPELNAYSDAFVACETDQGGVMYLDTSVDGTNWGTQRVVSLDAGLEEQHSILKAGRYFRVRVQNTSASPQTYLRLKTYYGQFRQLNSALNSTIREDADSHIVRTIDSELDISAGRHQGYSIVNKFGLNGAISTATVPEDVWQGSRVYPGFPSTAETLRALSSSASDALGGAGAERLQIQAITDQWELVTVTFTLNGLTPVAPDAPYTNTLFLRSHTGQVTQSANGANTSANVGLITVRHTTTVANVFLEMPAGTNQTNSSAYSIPGGYTGFMRSVHAAIRGSAQLVQTQSIEGVIYTRGFGAPWRMRRPFIATSNYPWIDTIYGGLIFTEKSDLILRVTSASANDMSISAGYDLLLVKNIV